MKKILSYTITILGITSSMTTFARYDTWSDTCYVFDKNELIQHGYCGATHPDSGIGFGSTVYQVKDYGEINSQYDCVGKNGDCEYSIDDVPAKKQYRERSTLKIVTINEDTYSQNSSKYLECTKDNQGLEICAEGKN